VEQYSESEAYQYARYNPYNIPELHEMLSISLKEDRNSNLCTNSNNCFSVLPWEIREAIAIYLSTRDVTNLLISSKAFLPLLTSQTFWKSRFYTGSDRDLIFETRSKQPKDWIYLYQMTNNVQSPPGLKNRKRIWSLAQALVDLLVRVERERQRELEGLLEHRAVSDFAHRNRIQVCCVPYQNSDLSCNLYLPWSWCFHFT